MTTKLNGTLIINHDEGCISFVNGDNNYTNFCIRNLPKPIPEYKSPAQMYDVLAGLITTNWDKPKKMKATNDEINKLIIGIIKILNKFKGFDYWFNTIDTKQRLIIIKTLGEYIDSQCSHDIDPVDIDDQDISPIDGLDSYGSIQ